MCIISAQMCADGNVINEIHIHSKGLHVDKFLEERAWCSHLVGDRTTPRQTMNLVQPPELELPLKRAYLSDVSAGHPRKQIISQPTEWQPQISVTQSLHRTTNTLRLTLSSPYWLRRLKQSGHKQLFTEYVISFTVPVQIHGYINMLPTQVYRLVLGTGQFQCFT